MSQPNIDVIIPVFNERESLPMVLGALPRSLCRHVIVVDNASTDGSADVAERLGAIVVPESEPGYGSACLAGLRWLRGQAILPDIVVFLDGDFSDHPEELPNLVRPIVDGSADLVVGSRTLGLREPGALLPQARFGNWLASLLIRKLYGLQVTDLGPFRAMRWQALESIEMRDPNFGWTAEMQVKVARDGLRYLEVPAAYRKRIGVSKITGTVKGTFNAGWKILYTVFRHRL